MSLHSFEPGDIEIFTIQTAPSTSYFSSSLGVTGSIYVYPRKSVAIKDFTVTNPSPNIPNERYVDDILTQARLQTDGNLRKNYILTYLQQVGSQPQSTRNTKKQEIIRFTPGYELNKNMTKKFVITNTLIPFYSLFGTNYDFSFTNYSSLNFFTGSGVPSKSALLYCTTGSTRGSSPGGIVSSSYIPSGAFSFDFWINPRYTTDLSSSEFKAGTIFHLSGGYALSLITGSSKDINGFADKYRLLLQLSTSAEILPSVLNPSSLSNLNFVSNDNSLIRNKWQHVTVRWGTNSYNFGSGSFLVDGLEVGTFYVSASSIAPRRKNNAVLPGILTIGNFLECEESGESSYFYTARTRTRFGVPSSYEIALNSASPSQDEPSYYNLNHPLNAEVHELKIYNKYLSKNEIFSRSLTSAPLNDPNLLFYLPPMFTVESPSRSVDTLGSIGGVLTHPFKAIGTPISTETPFNNYLSFDSGGHYINLENYTREFVNGKYPRIIGLTGSAMYNNTTQQLTSNEFLYATGSIRKASLTILPNDNGNFIPNYNSILKNLNKKFFKNDKGQEALNLITLRDLYFMTPEIISTITTLPNALQEGEIILNSNNNSIISRDGGGLNVGPIGQLNGGRYPIILKRTKENNSLQVVIFDISNLYYGNKIKPGTFVLSDNNVSNSYGKVSITLKDDGFGNLYRANSDGKIALYNSVGNIFYDDGIAMIYHPSLYFFGKTEFSCSFKGERNIHVMKADLYANALELVSSSNPGWSPSLQATDQNDDFDKRFVYITDLYLHDDNLNVIAKTKLAQPVLKRASDKFKFVTKIDF